MRGHVYFRRAGALTAVVAAGMIMSVAPGARADNGPEAPVPGAPEVMRGDPRDVSNWGTVLALPGCVQSDAWIARLKGLGGVVNTTLFQAHYPEYGQARKTAGGKGLVDLKIPDPTRLTSGLSFGQGNAVYAKAIGNALPGKEISAEDVATPCAAYAEAGGGMIDVGLPTIPGFNFLTSAAGALGGLFNTIKPLRPASAPAWSELRDSSPLRVHVEGIAVSARSVPGKPVEFAGNFAHGYVASFGTKVVDIPAKWPANFGVEVPTPFGAPLGIVTTNEQVTTNPNGTGTLAPGRTTYQYNPVAASGYINAIHVSVLGTNAADLTVGHAAVLNTTAVTGTTTTGTGTGLPVLLPCVSSPGREAACPLNLLEKEQRTPAAKAAAPAVSARLK
ncbi:hypothetical protein Aph01nite_31460 [Acrocarpospora phusangensis]|uniref:Uncharacterized protein n=1 Tax=Acrocarpospora phusangensis TaxID=1070424 RepID=A0A919Q9S0_9ACTN|nr:hypothetical protein [Acrocarpospora phusangensis]GIH24836.1 hypothetical protein Aph01nite_31460 [Acrocarpospora phusangensis]